MKTLLRVLLIGSFVLGLSSCKSAEEKAAEFYQSGLSLLEEGDLDRSIVEFQNVFKNDQLHKDARQALADTLMKKGDVAGAYRQYSILIEQYPNTAAVRLLLAQIAIDTGSWDEATRHGNAAFALVPENPTAQSVVTTLAYHDAMIASDKPAMAAAAVTAREQLDDDPYNDLARRIVVDDLLRGDTPNDAMSEITTALTFNQNSYPYHLLRLRLLSQNQDIPAIGKQLQSMVKRFPNDANLSDALIGWYLSQGDIEGAETFLRDLAGDDTGATQGHIAVVQLLRTAKGATEAQRELDRLAVANEGTQNADFYTALSAVITFQNGDKDTAITTIEKIVESAEPNEQSWRIRNILARLLIADDNVLAARAQVEETLAQDTSNVEALKLRATWAIEDDRPADAIIDLRTALGQEPRDSAILTLMARAHERGGSLALAGERLAQAVNVSGAGAAESVRYATFLQRGGRLAPAQSVLTDARTANPRNVEILLALADILLGQSSWVQAQGVADELRTIDTPAAKNAATSVQTALLLGQNGVSDSIAFLEDQIANGNSNATMQVVQIQLRAGNFDAARAALNTMLESDPTNPTLRTLNANLYAVTGDIVAAEAAYRSLVADYPTVEEPVLRLYNLLLAVDRAEDAANLVDAALEVQPQAMTLRWIRATALETAEDFEGAIAIYEAMYQVNSDLVVVANNLASLLVTHRDDAESLQRAATVSMRLRELKDPPFQDTYGWVAYRLGNFAEAETYLKPAAAGLADDPMVQFHLGMTYLALDQPEQARTALVSALELAGDSDLPQFDIARTKLAEIDG